MTADSLTNVSEISVTRGGTLRQRFEDIDRVKAIAILLVVIGHIPDPQTSPNWARTLRFDIYNFHMPLFMYLSGYVFYNAVNSPKVHDYKKFFLSRADRLLVPFLVFGALIVNIKYFARAFAHLRRSDYNYLDGYKLLFVHTSQNPAFDIWYLFVLFVYSVGSYYVMRRGVAYLIFLVPVSLAAYGLFAYYEPFGGMTDHFYIDRLCWFYIFFVLGSISSAYRSATIRPMQRYWPVALVLFFAAEWAINDERFAFLSGWRFLIIGLLSIVALQGALQSDLPMLNPVFRTLAKSTLIIYLLNTIIIAASQYAFTRLGISPDRHYALQLFALTLIGTIVPIMMLAFVARFEALAMIRRYIS